MRHSGLLALLIISCPLMALSSPIGTGTVELSGNFSASHQSISHDTFSGTATEIQSTLGLLYAVSHAAQIGGTVSLQNQSADFEGSGSTSSTLFSIGADLVFNFGTSASVVPFIDVGVGVGSFSGDGYSGSETAFLGGVSPGLRFMVDRFAAFTVFAALSKTSNVSGVEGADSTNLGLGAGISIFPGGVR